MIVLSSLAGAGKVAAEIRPTASSLVHVKACQVEERVGIWKILDMLQPFRHDLGGSHVVGYPRWNSCSEVTVAIQVLSLSRYIRPEFADLTPKTYLKRRLAREGPCYCGCTGHCLAFGLRGVDTWVLRFERQGVRRGRRQVMRNYLLLKMCEDSAAPATK